MISPNPPSAPARGSGMLAGGAVAAALASALGAICCLPFAVGAATLATAAVVLAPLRPYLIVLALALLAVALVRSWRLRCQPAGCVPGRRLPLVLVVAVVAVLVLLTAQWWMPRFLLLVGALAPPANSSAAEASASIALRDLNGLSELREAFNAAGGRPRVVLLLSPT